MKILRVLSAILKTIWRGISPPLGEPWSCDQLNYTITIAENGVKNNEKFLSNIFFRFYLTHADMTRRGRDYLQVGNAMEIFRRNRVHFIAVNNGIDSEKMPL